MLAPTHTVFGVFLSLTFLSVFGVSLSLHWSIIAVAILGSLAPDIDMPRSTIGRLFPFISNPLERKFGHRTVTHSLLGWLIMTLIFSLLLWLFFLALNLQAVMPTVSNYSRYTSAILSTLDIQLSDFNPWSLPKRWPIAFAIGYLSHLILDMFNPRGIQLFWPNKTRDIFFRNPKFRPETGSKTEIPIFIGLACLMLLSLPVSKHGVFTSLRWLLATPESAIAEFKSIKTQSYVTFDGTLRQTKEPISGKAEIIDVRKNQLIVLYDDTLYTLSDELSSDIMTNNTRVQKTDTPIIVTSLSFSHETYHNLLDHLTEDARVSGQIDLPKGLKLKFITQNKSSYKPLTQKNNQLFLYYASKKDLLALTLSDQFKFQAEKEQVHLESLQHELAQLKKQRQAHNNPNDGLTPSGRNKLQTQSQKQTHKHKKDQLDSQINSLTLKIREQTLTIKSQKLEFSGSVDIRSTGKEKT